MTHPPLQSAAWYDARRAASAAAAPTRAGGSAVARVGAAFLACLGVILYGYALSGRGFASLGVPPLYVGELALLVGVAFWMVAPASVWSGTLRRAWPVVLFMAWGACRTVPYLGVHGVDALRDAVLWGYGLFALTVLGCVLADPSRLARSVAWHRRFAAVFLVLGPLVTVATVALGDGMPQIPGTGRGVVDVKGGDSAVHTAGAVAFAAGLGGVPAAVLAWGVPAGLATVITGRAAQLTIVAGVGMVLWFRPRQPAVGRAALIVAVGVAVMWAVDFRYRPSGREDREVSVDLLVQNAVSTFGYGRSQEMTGTREWRLNWWGKIVGYTAGGADGVPIGRGEYFWAGKGFGVNLAASDGFSVDEGETLRAPHNGHMSVLARTGVVGAGLWLLLLGWWSANVGRSYLHARKHGRREWAGLFLFLAVYLACFCVNASFDVYLEGPMGGIWFWSVLGMGVAAWSAYGEEVGRGQWAGGSWERPAAAC